MEFKLWRLPSRRRWFILTALLLAAMLAAPYITAAAWADEPQLPAVYLPVTDLPAEMLFLDQSAHTDSLYNQYPFHYASAHYRFPWGEKSGYNPSACLELLIRLEYYDTAAGAKMMIKDIYPNATAEVKNLDSSIIHVEALYSFSGIKLVAAKGRYVFFAEVHSPSALDKWSKNDLEEAKWKLLAWAVNTVLKKLPGEEADAPVNSSDQDAIRKKLLKTKTELIAYHAELLECRTQIIEYRNKVVKIYQYNVAKLALAVVAKWLNPPRSMPAMAFKTISYILNEVGLTSSGQRDMEKAEVQRRLLILSQTLQKSADQYLAEAEKVRKMIDEINAALKKTSK